MLTVPVLLLIVIAVVGSGAMVAFLAWMIQRMRSLERGGAAGLDLERLYDELEELRSQLLDAREEVGELQARVDFNERLLEGSAGGESTPEAQTTAKEEGKAQL